MDLELPEEIKVIKSMVKKLVENEFLPLDDEIEEKNSVPKSVIEKMRESGLFGVTIPAEYGGQGLGMLTWCAINEELGRAHSIIRPLTYTNDLGSMPLTLFGTEDQKKKYLPLIANYEIIPSFALTEEEAGSDAANLKTVAKKDGQNFKISGKKYLISEVGEAGIYYIFANAEVDGQYKPACFIVEKNTPGLSFKKNERTLVTFFKEGDIILDNCPVPEENLIGQIGEGMRIALKTIETARMAISAFCVGCAKHLLDLSIEYAKQRIAFGKPISEYQAIQWYLADSKVDIDAARLMTYNVALRYDQAEKVTEDVAKTKLYATEMLFKVVDRAVQIHGGSGVMKELSLERHYRAARLWRVALGTSEMQKITIARNLL